MQSPARDPLLRIEKDGTEGEEVEIEGEAYLWVEEEILVLEELADMRKGGVRVQEQPTRCVMQPADDDNDEDEVMPEKGVHKNGMPSNQHWAIYDNRGHLFEHVEAEAADADRTDAEVRGFSTPPYSPLAAAALSPQQITAGLMTPHYKPGIGRHAPAPAPAALDADGIDPIDVHVGMLDDLLALRNEVSRLRSEVEASRSNAAHLRSQMEAIEQQQQQDKGAAPIAQEAAYVKEMKSGSSSRSIQTEQTAATSGDMAVLEKPFSGSTHQAEFE